MLEMNPYKQICDDVQSYYMNKIATLGRFSRKCVVMLTNAVFCYPLYNSIISVILLTSVRNASYCIGDVSEYVQMLKYREICIAIKFRYYRLILSVDYHIIQLCLKFKNLLS